MRVLYSMLWWVALPLVLLRLWRRGRKEPAYRKNLGERLGFYRHFLNGQERPRLLWVHAVSVGETRAAEPLIDALLQAYPHHVVLLTHMTATGRETGRQLFEKNGSRVLQSFFPYDTGWMCARFLRHFLPQICILMETEVWPNMMAQCVLHRVPVLLANARLSERSLRKGQRFGAILLEAAAGIDCVAAQSEADAARLKQFGARNVVVTGNLKFDVAVPEEFIHRGLQWRRQIGFRPVLLCASTREGEEKLILDALAAMDNVSWLTVIVPRHPQRFDEVAGLIVERGFKLLRRSMLKDEQIQPETEVILGDSMGEMFAYYAACDVAFIGGSLLPLGGQNLIEACSLGKPVLLGPHTFNFDLISKDATAAGAALRIADATELMHDAARLLTDQSLCVSAGQHAYDFARRYQGATQRTMKLIDSLIGTR